VADPVGEDLDRLHLQVVATKDLGETGEGDRTEALDPGHAVAGVKCGLAQVDVQHGARYESLEVDVAQRVEEVGGEREGTRRRVLLRLVELEVEIRCWLRR
jgi:hypothetical protein